MQNNLKMNIVASVVLIIVGIGFLLNNFINDERDQVYSEINMSILKNKEESENVNIDFDNATDEETTEKGIVEEVIESNVDNWRELLSNVNCIYVITDLSNGKLYVGSTYNWRGIWGRWSNYVYTNGHGGDVELKRLINDDPDYAIKNFQFSVLEVFLNSDDKDSHIKDREKYWANALDTAFPHGYNRNL